MLLWALAVDSSSTWIYFKYFGLCNMSNTSERSLGCNRISTWTDISQAETQFANNKEVRQDPKMSEARDTTMALPFHDVSTHLQFSFSPTVEWLLISLWTQSVPQSHDHSPCLHPKVKKVGVGECSECDYSWA